MALELHRNVQHGFLQQATARAELVGIDRLVLQAERDVEDLHILGRVGRLVGRERFATAQQGNRGGREGQAATDELTTFLGDGHVRLLGG